MGTKLTTIILASLILTLVPFSSDELVSDSQIHYSSESLIDFDDGYYQVFTESGVINISLNMMSTSIVNITYSVIDEGTIRYNGSIEINQSISNYNIPVNHHIISPCLCIMEIFLHSENGDKSVHRLIIEANNGEQTNTRMTLPIHDIDIITTSTIEIASVVNFPNTIELFILRSSIISNNENNEYCKNGVLNQNSITLDNISTDDIQLSNIDIVNGKSMISFNLSSYDDGWISILYQLGDGNNWSNTIGCINSKLDLLSPIIDIDAPSTINEKIGLLIIDASSSYDPKWGRENLQYFWSYQQIDDPYSTPISVIGDSNGIFTYDASKSGKFQFNLTIIDSASHSTTQSIIISIINIRPEANIRIDSVPVDDGEVIRLTNELSWNVDARYSTDTQNDIDDLTYTWFLDGNPMMSGIDRILSRPDNDNQMHELTLMVEDDDGAVDWVTVTIGIAGTPSDPNDSSTPTKIVAGISVFILLCTIISFFYMSRKSSKTPIIRQWNSSTVETTESRTED